MNKKLLLLLFLGAFATATFSQIKQIPSNEFYTSSYNAQKMLGTRSWRKESKAESMENGALVGSGRLIEEKLLPDRTRYLSTEKVGEKETTREIIRIGYMEYSRQDDGPWAMKDLRGSGNGIGNSSGGGISCHQFTEESDFVGSIAARKLRQFFINNSSEGLTYEDSTNWFSPDGAFIKSERSDGLLEPKIERFHLTVTYDYNADIKIEAPIK